MVIKRFLAFAIDYLVMTLYAMALYALRIYLFDSPVSNASYAPLYGQAIGFLSLTLPVFLYFYLSERSNFGGTMGKRVMHIQVVLSTQTHDRTLKIFLRNLLKFLPWEIAHTGVHWLIYYSENSIETPLWVWFSLILPQAVVLGYIVSIVSSGGKSSLYDTLAKTKVVLPGV